MGFAQGRTRACTNSVQGPTKRTELLGRILDSRQRVLEMEAEQVIGIGRARYGRMANQCSNYLMWAFRVASRSAAKWASKPPMSSSANATTLTGSARTSSISTNAPGAAKATALPSAPPPGTRRRPSFWLSGRVSPTDSPLIGAPAGMKFLSRSAKDRSAPNKVPRYWRYGSREIRELTGPPLANLLKAPLWTYGCNR